ncbi:MAG: F0F1 ATP synthase subunit delta [Spirochaetaceae bacterium]|jgi:F0F1-type ATP synthase delta subunit|nr:F0F1 ATP synthase subunit delta [Spirochaetaceae bacterium]
MSVPGLCALAWAQALVNAAGPEYGEALAFLKAAAPPLEKLPPTVSGYASGARLEAMLRSALKEAGGGEPGRGAEAAIRCVALLVRKGRFAYFASFAAEVEKIVDERDGTLRVLVESAAVPGAGFEDRLKAMLKRKKNAGDVRLDIRVVPELLAGCRIGMGGEYLDGSLLGRLKAMAKDLGSGAGATFGGME